MEIHSFFWAEQATSLKNLSSQIFPHFGEKIRENYQFCTQKSGGTFQVFNIEIRERLQADHWSSNCRGYLHIIMSKSLEVLMVIVFSPPQVSIDTFITSVVQIFREIELMYYNFFSWNWNWNFSKFLEILYNFFVKLM